MNVMIEHRMVQETKSANSFEFGKAGQRHKVYYETKEELQQRIQDALEAEQFLIRLTAK